MAPRSKPSKSRSTKRKSYTRSTGSKTDALLKKILAAVDRDGSTSIRHASQPYPRQPRSMLYQPQGFGSRYPMNVPSDYLQEHDVDGRPFVRMVCGPGTIPNYKDKKCEPGKIFNGKCGNNLIFDPFTGKCESTVNPRPGFIWKGDSLTNVGMPYGQDSWAHASTLPINWATE